MTVQQIVDGAQALTCCLPYTLLGAGRAWLLNQILSGNGSGDGVSLLAGLYDNWNFDSSLAGVNGHNFTVATPVFEAGKITSNAIRFNAGVAANCGQALTTTDLKMDVGFSGCFWFNFTTFQTAASNTLIGNLLGTTGARVLGRTGPSTRLLDPTGLNSTVNPLLASTWYFMTFGSIPAIEKFISVNAEAKNTNSVAADANPVSPLTIGIAASLSGQVSDMRMNGLTIWKGRTLSQAEIAYLYNAGAGRKYPFLI